MLFIFFLGIQSVLLAQETPDIAHNNELHFGLITGVFGVTDFESDPPFSLTRPLFIGPTWIHKKWAFSPFYNIGDHSAGMFLSYNFSQDLGTYFVVDDHLSSDFGIYGFGLTTPIIFPFVQGFVEIGSTYGEVNQTSLSIGAWIILSKKVSSW